MFSFSFKDFLQIHKMRQLVVPGYSPSVRQFLVSLISRCRSACHCTKSFVWQWCAPLRTLLAIIKPLRTTSTITNIMRQLADLWPLSSQQSLWPTTSLSKVRSQHLSSLTDTVNADTNSRRKAIQETFMKNSGSRSNVMLFHKSVLIYPLLIS